MATAPQPRIVYVLPRYDPATGSHFFHLYEMLERASRELDIFLIIERCRTQPAALAIPFYCQKFSFIPLRFLELVLILLRERVRGRRHFYTHYSFFGALASWFVVRVSGGTAYYWNAGLPWLYPRPAFAEAVFRFILRHTVLVTATAGLARAYQRRYGARPERTRVLPNGVNVARFQSAPGREESRQRLGIPLAAKVVLFAHRLSRRKGAHLLPEIIAEVVKHKKDVMFVIVGGGPEKKNLESRIKNQGLERYVRIIGEVPHRDLPAYYHVADVFLLPSEEEGSPHVLLESMAAGVPYVASDVGGVREITPLLLQKYLVPNDDIPKFVAKIVELFSLSDVERTEISRAGQEWVKRYDVHSILPKFISLFTN